MKKIKKETKVNTGIGSHTPEPIYKYIIVDGQVKKAKEEKTSHNKVYFTEYQVGYGSIFGRITMTVMHQEKDVQVFETEQEARTEARTALLEQKIAKIEKSVLRFFL